MFSLMRQIKTDGRTSLSEKNLSNLTVICMEGPEPEFFNPITLMTLWNDAVKSRRPNQAGNCSYKKHNKKTTPPTLRDLEESSDDSDSARENILSSLEQSN